MEENINIEIKFNASLSIAKRKIKNGIKILLIFLGIKPKSIFKEEKLFIKYNKDTFADGAFYIVPKVINDKIIIAPEKKFFVVIPKKTNAA
ncbi:hypothetical protein H8356DRAFT_1324190 [Neocallimastix lanati (nom. inval.)]|nr:hypothetical protein H8356DRAFT_1324190 [Neocallimastix sp. JGI-2020a]